MINITKFPVVIVSNYRTGSSALCDSIGSLYNIASFIEPSEHGLAEFQQKFNSGNSAYVIKFIVDQIETVDMYQRLLYNDNYKIRLTRSDKLDQITSFYIAKVQNKWWNLNTDILESYEVPVNQQYIEWSINKILANDKLLNSLNTIFDLELTYEELGIITHTNTIKTPNPVNIEFIKDKIRKELKKYE